MQYTYNYAKFYHVYYFIIGHDRKEIQGDLTVIQYLHIVHKDLIQNCHRKTMAHAQNSASQIKKKVQTM